MVAADASDPSAATGALDRPGALSPAASELYRHAMRSGGKLLRARLPESSAAGPRQELEALGLLVPDVDDPGLLVAVDPRRLAESMTASLLQQALQLLSRSIALPAEWQELSEAYEEHGSLLNAAGICR